MGRKAVVHAMLSEDPEPTGEQYVARIRATRGGGLYEAELLVPSLACESASLLLLALPSKFHKVVWVKRGSLVIVEPAAGTTSGKVHGDIVHVLLAEHVKALQAKGKWPMGDDQVPDRPAPSAAYCDFSDLDGDSDVVEDQVEDQAEGDTSPVPRTSGDALPASPP